MGFFESIALLCNTIREFIVLLWNYNPWMTIFSIIALVGGLYGISRNRGGIGSQWGPWP